MAEPPGKVFPRWVMTLDEPDFLFTAPSLDPLLARNRAANVAEHFDVDQAKNPVPRCESGNESLAMFGHSALEIAGHAGVQVSRPAGEDVNAIGAVHFRLANCRSLTAIRKERGWVRDDTQENAKAAAPASAIAPSTIAP